MQRHKEEILSGEILETEPAFKLLLIGGNHSGTALKLLNQRFPDQERYKYKMGNIFADMGTSYKEMVLTYCC